MDKYKYLNEFNKNYNIQFNIFNYTKNELFIINNILSKNNLDNIIDINSSNILRYIGLIYYYKYNNKDNAQKYYLMAIELNNNFAMNNYAILLEKENKIEEAKEYYLMAINLNNSNAMNNYANLLAKENKIEEAKEYYLMAIDLNNSNAMDGYANLLYNKNKIEEAKKYFLMAIDLNNSNAMNDYANLLYKENKIEEAKKYFLMAIDLNNSYSMNNYAVLLYKKNKIEEAKEYFLMAINLNNDNAMNDYNIIEKNELKKYYNLKKINNELTKNKIFELEKKREIIVFNNKIKNLSIKKDCDICYESDKLNILLNCFGHYICIDCYLQLYNEKCPLCRL